MNIEEEIFKKGNFQEEKLIKYGFKRKNNKYILKKTFLNNSFQTEIEISNNKLTGKVFDLDINEEYTNLRTNSKGEFAGKVRDAYKEILLNIKENCFKENTFLNPQTNRINNYIKEKYKDNPEFLWSKFPGYAIYRNKNNEKWYSIIMNISSNKLDKDIGEVEIINIKLNENKKINLLKKEGFYKAYHMNKKDWISIILNDTLEDKEIFSLIDESYEIINENEEWIIPANPKYYDIVNCFNTTDEIIWKQSSNIHINDIVYLYVAAPYSKIMYKCKAVEVNIPYSYKDNNIKINNIMKLKLLEDLKDKNYSFEYLNTLGIKSIRGPRKIKKGTIS